jgi:hypothetical protein
MTTQTQHAIILARQNLHLDRGQWQNWAVFLARLSLDAAPEEIRLQFMGLPSHTSPKARTLAEIFALLQAKAEDQAQATHTTYRTVDLWSGALKLQEASHE